MRFNESKCKALHLGCSNLHYQYKIEYSPGEKKKKELDKKRSGQQIEGTNPAPPFCVGETPPGALHLNVES